MKAHLVLARIPDLAPDAGGAPTTFVAMFESEQEATEAVEKFAPDNWIIEGVVGTASDETVSRLDVKEGQVVQMK